MWSAILMLFLTQLAGEQRPICPSDWQPHEVHGIHLGMTTKQVKSKLPFLEIPPADKYEVSWASLFVTTDRMERRRLPRVFKIEMWFLKDRLVRYNIQYYGSERPSAVMEFVNRVIKGFNLSEKMRVSYRRYECGNIIISIGEENRKTVSLREKEAEAILNKRVEDSYRKD